MTLPDPSVVDARLRRLDTDALTALAADLWSARGFAVERDGELLTLRKRGTERRVWVTSADRGSRTDPPDRPVDVVLAPRPTTTTRRVAAANDARHVDVRGLRAELFYGVERPVWTTLCERHLGGPPTSLSAPPATRVRMRGRAAVRDADAAVERLLANPTSALGTVAVVLLVLLLLAGGTFGPGLVDSAGPGLAAVDDPLGALSGEPAQSSPPPKTDADTGGTATPTPTREPTSDSVLADAATVPGVTRDGIENLSALTAAHERAVTNRSYTLWFDGYRQDVGQPETRVQRDVDIRVEGGRTLLVAETEANGTRTSGGRAYYDGSQWYRQEAGDGANTTWRQASSLEVSAVGPSPFDYQAFRLRQSLATPTIEVGGVQRVENQTYYRLVGRGTPPGPFAEQISDYTVVALVDGEGFVADLTVEYVVTADQPYQVRYEWTYGRLDETTVESPLGE